MTQLKTTRLLTIMGQPFAKGAIVDVASFRRADILKRLIELGYLVEVTPDAGELPDDGLGQDSEG
jgi:hypothetical protein